VKGNNRDLAINPVVAEFESSGNNAGDLANPTGIDPLCLRLRRSRRPRNRSLMDERGLKVLPVAKHDLGAVESDSFDAETNLAWAGLRKREFIKLKDFGASGVVGADDFTVLDMRTPELQISP
jgi:hypothetical protein